jgi:putative ABC transport system permease protein
MSLWSIAWKSIKQRGLASALTMLSMALGVMMVVGVLTILGVVEESFRNNAQLGYNMIVGGGKGGPLELTLNSVYYLSRPSEPVPYDYYLEYLPAEVRAKELKNSLAYAQYEAQAAALELASLQNEGIAPLTDIANADVMDRGRWRALEHERDGRFAIFTEFAIPLCLGDYFGKFRVIGTTPQMFEISMTHEDGTEAPMYEFAQGRNFQTFNEEHGWFEAVVGSTVAREMNVKLGDVINPAHGDPEGHGHGQGFTVVGILKPSGRPVDRAAFINIEGFYLLDDHAKPFGDEESQADAPAGNPPQNSPAAAGKSKWAPPLAVEKREVTSFLVRTALVDPDLPRRINEGPVAQAVLPIREITNLMDSIVKPIQQILLVLTFLICLVSGVSILVSIYNSMSDRRRDIAVMRALGAGRSTVFLVILCESLILAVGGGLLGMVLGHTLNAIASPVVVDYTGVSIGFLSVAPGPRISEVVPALADSLPLNPRLPLELLIVPAMVLLAIVVGLLPAWTAYRTDVSKSLAP